MYIELKLSLLPRFRAERLEPQSGEHESLVKLYGRFSEPVGAEDQSTYFYLPDLRSIYGLLLAPVGDQLRCFAQFWASDIENAELLSFGLYFFAAYDSRQFHLAIDPDITWREVTFASSPASSTSFTGIDGKSYRKLEHYHEGTEIFENSKIVLDGWDHEHCTFCNRHIDPGDIGFRSGNDWNDEWACGWCYRNAVEKKDPRPLLVKYSDRT